MGTALPSQEQGERAPQGPLPEPWKGRARKEDTISYGAGIECLVKPGEPVTTGQPLLKLHADDQALFEPAVERLAEATSIGPEPPTIPDVVIERIAP